VCLTLPHSTPRYSLAPIIPHRTPQYAIVPHTGYSHILVEACSYSAPSTHARARAHTHTHTGHRSVRCTRGLMAISPRSSQRRSTCPYRCVRVRACARVCERACANPARPKPKPEPFRSARTQTQACARARTHACTHTHAHTDTHTRARAHARTHTHTGVCRGPVHRRDHKGPARAGRVSTHSIRMPFKYFHSPEPCLQYSPSPLYSSLRVGPCRNALQRVATQRVELGRQPAEAAHVDGPPSASSTGCA
jgi:hypothetical protein